MRRVMSHAAVHIKCRGAYPGAPAGVTRFAVPDDKVDWKVAFPEYHPVDYTAAVVAAKPVWADPEIRSDKTAQLKWHNVDGKNDRRSFEGEYEIVDGLPRNPRGRTGMVGRGLLGKWGPNHAADPVVTRWKRDASGKIEQKNGKPVLEFVAIKRNDGGGWAIPGGMVDPGEAVTVTCKREFGEEALNSEGVSAEEKHHIEAQVNELFKNGVEVYKGYVDDPRNTDNAWMETVALNFHDESGEVFGKFKLHAGDDAGAVKWMPVDGATQLYASHIDFVRNVAHKHNAHF